ncbi:uncharacterized protein LOC143542675 [Bidens hawaiensis]|uniref:uncharacterized protein LOC143542675 n=1 Tax=Bidens hawaiensis TaxID=980011 RepID=UPI00404A961D
MKMKGKTIAHCLEAVKLTKQMVKWMESVKSLGRVCGAPIVPRKRSSEDSNEKLIRKPKPMAQTVQNFPLANCGIKESDTKPLKNLTNVPSDVENKKLMSSLRPNKFGRSTYFTGTRPPKFIRNKPSSSSKPAGKVKFWDPLAAGHDRRPKVTTTIHISRGKPLQNSENVENEKCEKIKEAMNVFDQVYPQLLHENQMKIKGGKIGNWRVPLEAVNLTKQMLKWMEPVKSLGPICGVKIGDKFKYQAQLKMIGLHCQLQSGIDYTNIKDGLYVANRYTRHRNEDGKTMFKYHLNRVPGQPALHQMLNASC